MKHKTLFRLLLKVVGVLVFIQGTGHTVANISFGLISLIEGPVVASYYLGWTAGGLAQMGLGLYLFFGGKWIADKAIPGNRPYCHECGYGLTGAVHGRCPECDTPFRLEDVRPSRGLDDDS